MANMVSGNTIAEVARVIGDPARANMLAALMGGQALTAGELARHAGVTPQTTSGHLARLAEMQLVTVAAQGRHRYYRLASVEVAQVLDALMSLAAGGPRRYRAPGPRDEAMRLVRTCYDHMAGRLAVGLADALVRAGHVVLADGAGLVTGTGQRFLEGFGIDPGPSVGPSRPLCRTCLDWSERRPHLAGRLGAALLDGVLARGWLVRLPGTRALRLTREGEVGLIGAFGLPVDWRREVGVLGLSDRPASGAAPLPGGK